MSQHVASQDTTLVQGWQVAQYDPGTELHPIEPPRLDGLAWIEATVPGVVNYDLVAAGAVNPFAGAQQSRAAQWVGLADWVYRTTFSAGDAAPYALEFEGIDTFADVWLNGTLLGRTANAFRAYRFPIPQGVLRGHDDELVIHVKGHVRMIEPMAEEARQRIAVQGGSDYRRIKSLVRRYQRNTFSNSSLLNLGVHVLGIGLYKPVRLLRGRELRISGAHVTTERADAATAAVGVTVTTREHGPSREGRTVEITLTEPETGRFVASGQAQLVDGTARVDAVVDAPRLWWPRGYGSPYLYELTVRVVEDGIVLDERVSRVGLRQVELIRDDDGRPTFALRVNGQRVYVRGTNLVPVDYLKVHADDPAVYERLLTLVETGNHNLIRLWGGGAIEDERLFERCDELGIMLWQDMFLHSNAYPDYDAEFVEEFRGEARELLLRMRDHAALVVVCGGNEQVEGWDEWNWQLDMDDFYGRKLAFDVSREVATEVCPELPFIENSPHGGKWAQSPVEGDTHTWGNFFNATKDPQFVTETCWNIESYSRPETLRAVMGLDVDGFADASWARRWTELTGLAPITKFPFSSYHDFRSLRDYLRGLEIEHAMADYHALAVLRLRSSSCTGIVYWSLNKGGPLFPFGCVDYGGYPLMNYYVLKRLFAEVCVGVYRDIDDIHVVASNATGSAVDAELRLTHVGTDGETAEHEPISVTVRAGAITRLLTLPDHYRRIRDRTREAVHVELVVGGRSISSDTLFFCPLSEVRADGHLKVSALGSAENDRWTVEVESTGLVKMAMLESNHKLLFSDNYFPLVPGARRQVEVTLLERTGDGPVSLMASALDDDAELSIVLS